MTDRAKEAEEEDSLAKRTKEMMMKRKSIGGKEDLFVSVPTYLANHQGRQGFLTLPAGGVRCLQETKKG